MYRLLIVDDLPIIVDGLLELFEQTVHLPLHVMKAYSGEEALELLKNNKIDIVISDIKMPGVGGIELLQKIQDQWPSCKVIFLTGYNDFSYARSVITYGGFEYILKVESDEKIIESVERAIAKIEEEQDQQQVIAKAHKKMRQALPSLQKEYMWGLLQGKQTTESQLQQVFHEVDIPLDAEKPVYMLLGRVDAWKEMFTTPDKALLTYAYQNITDEYLSEHVRCFSFVYDLSRIVWLIQPKEGITASDSSEWPKGYQYTRGILESVQQTCKKLLGLSVSFVIGTEQTAWSHVSDRFHSIKYCFVYGHGLSSGVILNDNEMDGNETRKEAGSRQDFFYHTRVQFLMTCLENNHKEQFFKQYAELTAIWNDPPTPYERKTELYHSLSAVFLSYINKNEVVRDYVNTLVDLDPLFKPNDNISWPDLTQYFYEMAACIFDWNDSCRTELPAEVIQKVHRYIEENIADDISLNALADYVGLNPSYFSRLYKQMTGIGLSKYVNDYRNLIAKEMLLNTSMKVNEIAAALGYNSALAFIRFFKKQNDEMTPQEYRMVRSST